MSERSLELLSNWTVALVLGLLSTSLALVAAWLAFRGFMAVPSGWWAWLSPALTLLAPIPWFIAARRRRARAGRA